jgi:phosphate transport system substrate-binding protein
MIVKSNYIRENNGKFSEFNTGLPRSSCLTARNDDVPFSHFTSHISRFTKIAFCSIFLFCSCNRGGIITRFDTETSGDALIGSDECLAPVVKEELDVFMGLNPEANITPIYTGENELFKLLLSDSIRLIVAARDITDREKEKIKAMKLTPRSQMIAKDGIALIINKKNTDSLINISQLQKIMTGEITNWNQLNPKNTSISGKIHVVFDNQSSSTLRFINDSIVRNKSLSPDLRAVESNAAVIEYVAKMPNALGVIGVNWISNPYDSTKLSFDESIRVMSVGREKFLDEDNTYKPFPVYLNNNSYPLTRDIYIILTDLRGTLPAGFVKFVAGDAGQRIILKAGLVPATRPTREIYIKESF